MSILEESEENLKKALAIIGEIKDDVAHKSGGSDEEEMYHACFACISVDLLRWSEVLRSHTSATRTVASEEWDKIKEKGVEGYTEHVDKVLAEAGINAHAFIKADASDEA